MVALSFGALCFRPYGEQSITMVFAQKSECVSKDDFITKALDYMNTDAEFCDNYNDMFKNRIYEPASEADIQFIINKLSSMNHCVNMILEPFENVLYVKKPEWNDLSFLIETIDKYIFYWWGTSA